MRIVLLGAPGAGKGTQAENLVKKLRLTHISTGDMFRAAISSGTVLGNEAKKYTDAGQLVPDELTISIIRDRISMSDCKDGFILDGFPRTIVQAESLDTLLSELRSPLNAVIDIDVPLDKIMVRLTGRRMCENCGNIYHVFYNPPQEEGVCDACGGALYQRRDDTEETVANRLDVYQRQTAPLIEYYTAKGLLRTVNGDQPINDVIIALGKAIGEDWS